MNSRKNMDFSNYYRTAEDVMSYAIQRGVDLRALHAEGVFTNDRRWIFLWRTGDQIHYQMQGRISILPGCMREESTHAVETHAVDDVWGEEGSVESLEEAFLLLSAWLLDRREVDLLPRRTIRRAGI
jgi:hypothetical protein